MDWKFKYYDIEKGYDWIGLEKYQWYTDMHNVEQDPIWHAEGDVMIHTKMVCEALINLPEFQELSDEEKHIMATVALFHDVEKRSTTTEKEKDGRICIVAPKHALYGSHTTNRILYKDIPTPFIIRRQIVKYVEYHGIPLFDNSDRLLPKMLQASQTIKNKNLAMFSKADVLGRYCNDQEKLLDDLEFFVEFSKEYNCYDKPYDFTTNLRRHQFLGKKKSLHYIPYEEDKFEVHMICGIAGAGKDTFIKNNLSNLPMVSLDNIRRENKIKPTDKKGNGRVIQMGKEACKVNLRKKQPFVFNATNITKDMRQKWCLMFEDYGANVIIYYVESDYKKVLKQNSNREYKVPDKVIEKMINKLELPSYDEACNIINCIYD